MTWGLFESDVGSLFLEVDYNSICLSADFGFSEVQQGKIKMLGEWRVGLLKH